MAPLCVALLGAALVLAVAAEGDHVITLSSSNFLSTIETPDQITLVEFFAPWCGHCKSLAPEYAKAAEILSATTPRVRLATVDATIEKALADQHRIEGYPTLKIFRDGKVYDYDGPREASGIAEFMRAQADPAWAPPANAVVELTDENFDAVTQGKLVLVEFYAPWCGHCKALEPKFERAAKQLAKLSEPIVLAKLDATKHEAIAKRFTIPGYPMLKVFRTGVDSEFKGGREADEIVQEMQELASPAAERIEDAVALHMRTKRATSLLAIAFLDSSVPSDLVALEAAAQDLRKQVKVVYTFHEGARKQYGVPVRTLVLLQPSRFQSSLELPRATTSLAGVSAETIVDFVNTNKYPLVGHRTTMGTVESPAAHRYDERPVVLVFFDVQYTPDLEAETNYWREQVLKVARQYRAIANKGLYFAIADETEYRSELTDLGVSATDDREVIVAIHDKDYRYVMKDEFDAEALEDFVQKFLDGNLKPFIKSQKASKKMEGGVTVVVGSTFDKIVLDQTKDVLLEIYAPWCGHCKALAPIYSQLAKKLKGVPDLVIAKIDATVNDVPPAFRPEGYPSIVLVRKGTTQPQQYDGPRELDALLKFLREQTSAAIPKDEL